MSMLALGGAMANDTAIISDTFTGAGDGVSLEGRTPDTSLSGAVWMRPTSQLSGFTSKTSSGQLEGFGTPPPGAFTGPQNASAVSISSTNAYIKPTTFTISADLSPKNTVGAASHGRGIALGFFSSSVDGTGDFSSNQFIGLVLDAEGNLALVDDPSPTGYFGSTSTIDGPVAFGGTFDPNLFYTLSYTVNTVTGKISNIRLSGSSADYSSLESTAHFTDSATAYAGFYGSSEKDGNFAALDNITVVAVPEPSPKSGELNRNQKGR